jgi:hypothetical protein
MPISSCESPARLRVRTRFSPKRAAMFTVDPRSDDAAEQLVEAKRRPARPDAPAVAVEQAVAGQFAHRPLYRVPRGEALAVALHLERQLQDRELRRVQGEHLREHRRFNDLVLAGGRRLALLDMVVVHGSSYLLCHAPGCLRSAGALF